MGGVCANRMNTARNITYFVNCMYVNPDPNVIFIHTASHKLHTFAAIYAFYFGPLNLDLEQRTVGQNSQKGILGCKYYIIKVYLIV